MLESICPAIIDANIKPIDKTSICGPECHSGSMNKNETAVYSGAFLSTALCQMSKKLIAAG